MNNERTIIAQKSKVLDTLKKNREKHKAAFTLAMKGWELEVKERLEKELKVLADGGNPDINFHDLDKPWSYTDEYDVVIDMLEFDETPKVELTSQEFKRFVRDDWEFKRSWSASNTAYITRASGC